jgi:hypothetical protein
MKHLDQSVFLDYEEFCTVNGHKPTKWDSANEYFLTQPVSIKAWIGNPFNLLRQWEHWQQSVQGRRVREEGGAFGNI